MPVHQNAYVHAILATIYFNYISSINKRHRWLLGCSVSEAWMCVVPKAIIRADVEVVPTLKHKPCQ